MQAYILLKLCNSIKAQSQFAGLNLACATATHAMPDAASVHMVMDAKITMFSGSQWPSTPPNGDEQRHCSSHPDMYLRRAAASTTLACCASIVTEVHIVCIVSQDM